MKQAVFKNLILLFIIIILSVAAVVSNLSLFPRRYTGSFEYVRKGEELLDKSRYVQAINYFEKAHESSPDNETIDSSLVYAYSMYSRELARENKHDEAISYLDKACEVTPNSSTTQNLAMAYSEKALYEARKGDAQAAKNSYAKARQYASSSGVVSRNLGIVLYNDGISEFKSGRDDIAILCFKESSFIYKDARTFEMLGDMYYKRAELKKARFYWHAAALLSPNNIVLSKKIKKTVREMVLAAGEREALIPHFEIRYTKDLPIDKDLATKTLEKVYADVGKDLGYFPAASTKVFFYSKEDFRKTFNMPYFVKAFYDGSIKIPAPETYLDKERFAQFIYHEYTHAIISAKTNNNYPVWFSEGVAVWEEFNKNNIDMQKLTKDIRNVPEISFKYLDKIFETDEINNSKAMAYIVAYTFVDFIVNNWGMHGLRGILKRLRDKQHIANAIDDEFLMSEGEFEGKWRNYALEKFFKNTL